MDGELLETDPIPETFFSLLVSTIPIHTIRTNIPVANIIATFVIMFAHMVDHCSNSLRIVCLEPSDIDARFRHLYTNI